MAGATDFDLSMTFDYGVARELAPGVRRIVARNPSPMTFKGTNTYLVGRRELAVIDPGPDDPRHRRAIVAAAGRAPITHILLTHAHADHCAGAAALREAAGAPTYGFATSRAKHRRGSSFRRPGFVADVHLADGGLLEGPDWSLRAIHTPGHAPDHLCFELTGARVLFSGDHVMGWNTTVIAPPEGRMGDYLASLDKLTPGDHERYLPGHGDVVRDPRRLLRFYLMHRQMREASIRACVQAGLTTVPEIADRIYRGISPSVLNAARLSVLAHLQHLVEKGIVVCDGEPGLHQRFRPGV